MRVVVGHAAPKIVGAGLICRVGCSGAHERAGRRDACSANRREVELRNGGGVVEGIVGVIERMESRIEKME